MTKLKIYKTVFVGLMLTISFHTFSQTILNTPNIESKLYLGKGTNQPLVVGLGGSEGGNAWASDYLEKDKRSIYGAGICLFGHRLFWMQRNSGHAQ